MMVVTSTESFTNKRGQRLHCRYWKGQQEKCLVFLSHGFSEHLGLYNEIGTLLGKRGMIVFGHDHIGHGESDGSRAYIENVDHYVDDVITHCMKMQDEHPDLPLFLIGHSMGGMIALRSVLRHPGFFSGMILNGPLIVPGPQIGPIDFRSTPFRTFVSKAVLQLLSWVIPHMPIGRPNMNIITRDKEAQTMMLKDDLRWTGGCKVMLLLAFVYCLDDNINQLTDVTTPFLLVHGDDDRLCNPIGSELLYRRSKVLDKSLKIFPGAKHQLFLELESTRSQVFSEIENWIERRI